MSQKKFDSLKRDIQRSQIPKVSVNPPGDSEMNHSYNLTLLRALSESNICFHLHTNRDADFLLSFLFAVRLHILKHMTLKISRESYEFDSFK